MIRDSHSRIVAVCREGQCGLCRYFDLMGASNPIRLERETAELEIGACRLAQNAALHLRVTATSGCDAFELDPALRDEVEEASEESFPASDAPAWSGVTGA